MASDNRGTFSGAYVMQILSALSAMPDEISGLIVQVPAGKLAWTPPTWEGIPGERFTALGQACHLRDIEIDGYHVRFGRTLREDRPDLIRSTAMSWRASAGTKRMMRAPRSTRSGRLAVKPSRC